MAEGEATAEQSANAPVDSLRIVNDVGKQRGEADVHQVDPGLRHLPSAWREYRFEESASSEASQRGRKPVSVVLSHHQGLRREKARQGGSVRQYLGPEFEESSLARRSARQYDERKGQRNEVVPVHHGEVPKAFRRDGKGLGDPGATSISTQTRRRCGGSGKWQSRLHSGEGSWKMVNRPIGEAIHQDGEDSNALGPTLKRRAGVLSLVSSKSSQGPERPDSAKALLIPPWEQDVFTLDVLPDKFALEIFAGTARVCRELNQHGIVCFPIDICMFRHHDVLDTQVEHKIFNWIKTGRVIFIWCGMPCTSFSRARKWDGLGPGPLRTTEQLWGLTDLSFSDNKKVQTGNLLLLWSVRLFRLCADRGIAVILENPKSSLAWQMPPIVRILQRHDVSLVHLDHCQFGELWKKPTFLMACNIDISCLHIQCHTMQGRCSRTKRPHIPLLGVDYDGTFMTLKAQPYPWALARQVTGCVTKALGLRGLG